MISDESKYEEVQKKKKERKRRSIWTKEWIVRYLQFVLGHIKIFEQKKIDEVVFKKMAEYVNCHGKGPTECYNFHDRMKKKYKSPQNIIKELKEKHDIKSEDLKAQAQKITNTKKEIFGQIQMMLIRDNKNLATLKRFKQQGLNIQPEKIQTSNSDQERQKSRTQQLNDSIEPEQDCEKKYKFFEATVEFEMFVDLQLSRKKQKR